MINVKIGNFSLFKEIIWKVKMRKIFLVFKNFKFVVIYLVLLFYYYFV